MSNVNTILCFEIPDKNKAIIYDFLTQRDNPFDGLSDDIKEVFYRRENVLLFIQNPTFSFSNLNKSFNDVVSDITEFVATNSIKLPDSKKNEKRWQTYIYGCRNKWKNWFT